MLPKRPDLSGFDAEFPVVRDDPNAQTIGSVLADMEHELRYLQMMMIADRSDSVAQETANTIAALAALRNKAHDTGMHEFPWDWWPPEDA